MVFIIGLYYRIDVNSEFQLPNGILDLNRFFFLCMFQSYCTGTTVLCYSDFHIKYFYFSCFEETVKPIKTREIMAHGTNPIYFPDIYVASLLKLRERVGKPEINEPSLDGRYAGHQRKFIIRRNGSSINGGGICVPFSLESVFVWVLI